MRKYQEPKYDVANGRLFNRVSGESIPDDEPVFILRARDVHAVATIGWYAGHCKNQEHVEIVKQRWLDFQQFRDEHPERMKEPDSP